MTKTTGWARFGLPLVAAFVGLTGPAAMAATELISAAPSKAAAQAAPANGLYIVQLADQPLAADENTRRAVGRKLDTRSPAARALVARLKGQQLAMMARAGVTGRVVHQYTAVLNGFAARMTPQQAAHMAAQPGVLSVVPDELRHLDTSSTPTFLGLSGPGGFYATTGAKGEDVVIGIVDTGIWPEHPSLDATGFGPAPAGWSGTCAVGAGFTAANCSNKLIGARFFNAGFGGNAGISATFPYEYNSPRDADGHGTHTSTTSGGNEAVSTAGSAVAALGPISGIAPRARIATYKVCWGRGGSGGCYNADSVAAIEQAVLDGVDVINFSISGTNSNLVNPVETAFRHAAAAGVFIAASAGNSGPALQTVAHPSPWITTVAAGTHDRSMSSTLTQGNAAVFAGASLTPTAIPAGTPMVLSSSAVGVGKDPTDANLCYSSKEAGGNALNPAVVAGKIVVCDRGVNDRVNKSLAVLEAGGIGMVLLNTSANSLNADLHSVPTVHLPDTARAAVRAYVAGAGATGAISATSALTVPAPFTASFSSRGPSRVTGTFDLLKPDIIAPGADILAGVSPDGYSGSLFGLLSGTSMSSPHIAGIAALLKQLHPGWSPMAIKSALMTSSGDVLDGADSDPNVIWRQGAGHVRPAAAANPGLVFDSGPDDWEGLLCGQGVLSMPTCHLVTMDASDLNVASIAIGDIPGSQTVRRRVTNVSGGATTFSASYTGLDGYTVNVQPPALMLAAGETGAFAVTFTRTTAPVFNGFVSDFRGGQLTWSAAGTTVRMPVIISATAATATVPAQIQGGVYTLRLKMNVGYTGSFRATPRGLVPAILNTGTATSGSSQIFPVVVPASTTIARFSLFDADVTPGSDINLVVRHPGGAVVGTGEGTTSQEQVNLVNPTAGTYTVEVRGVGVPGSSPFKLHSWVLGTASERNLTVRMPTAVTAGQQIDILLLPSRALAAGNRYLGSVAYTGNAGLPAPTLVEITP